MTARQPARFTLGVPGPRRFRRYVAAVTCVGFALLVAMAPSAFHAIVAAPAPFWVIAALALTGEFFPVRIPRRNEVEEITISPPFLFALVMVWGVSAGIFTAALICVTADVVHRKSLWKVLVNAAQYALVTGAAGGAYFGLGGSHALSVHDLAPFVVAACARFTVNDGVAGTGVALFEQRSVHVSLLEDLGFQAGTSVMLLALAPIIVLVSHKDVLFAPLMLSPIAAVYLASRLSVQNSGLVTQLEASLAELREANRLKDEFIAMVSHELRTPLTSVQGYVKTLLREDVSWSEHDRLSFLTAADRQGQHLHGLIEQLLSVVGADGKHEMADLRETAVVPIINDVVEEIARIRENHRFETHLDHGVGNVWTEPAKLRQIVCNLVENAAKYSPAGSSVVVGARLIEDGVVVSVQDQGPGIPEALHAKVFERFYQVDQSNTRVTGGLGLGLYLCRRFAESIGAELWIERSGSSGTTFCLRLPLRADGTSATVQPEGADALAIVGSTPALSELPG